MILRKIAILITIVISMLIAKGSSAQNLITNGNFETGTASSWVKASGKKIHIYNIHDSSDPTVATKYHYVAGLNVVGDEDSISQKIAVKAGKKYSLDFDFGGRAGTTSAQNIMDVYFGTKKVINGVTVTPKPGLNDKPVYTWTHVHYVFKATTNDLKIKFASVGSATTVSTSYLDNVSIKVLPVPEASTVILFAAFIMSGCLVMRKRTFSMAGNVN